MVCSSTFTVTREVPEICFSEEGNLRSSDPQAAQVLPNICNKLSSKQSQYLLLTALTFIILELCQCVILWYVHPILVLFLRHLLEKKINARWTVSDLVKPSCEEVGKITGILASLRVLEQTALIS